MANVPKLTTITRSFSRKLNMGNYEMAEVFCSRGEECFVEEAEATSRRLMAFAKKQVYQDIAEYKASRAKKR